MPVESPIHERQRSPNQQLINMQTHYEGTMRLAMGDSSSWDVDSSERSALGSEDPQRPQAMQELDNQQMNSAVSVDDADADHVAVVN